MDGMLSMGIRERSHGAVADYQRIQTPCGVSAVALFQRLYQDLMAEECEKGCFQRNVDEREQSVKPVKRASQPASKQVIEQQPVSGRQRASSSQPASEQGADEQI